MTCSDKISVGSDDLSVEGVKLPAKGSLPGRYASYLGNFYLLAQTLIEVRAYRLTIQNQTRNNN